MPPNIGFASMQVIPSLRGMDAAMRSQVVGIGQQAGGVASSSFGTSMDRGLSQSIGKTGGTLTRTLTPAAAAVGLIGKRMFDQWDTGLDAIRTGTGATGKDLDALGSSFKRVSARVTAPLGEVGTVLADLQTRTGLTGESLETLTQRTLELARIQGDQGIVLSEKLTRVFGDWSVSTENQAGAMDKLFRASQATGPPVSKLSDLVVQFGAPLRQFGFGLEQSAALLGKFEKEGVNTELVMGSLRQGLGKLARSGEKDIPKAFQRVVGEIQNAGSAGEANARAMEIFGARAGPDMAAAIREGRFDLGELFKQVTEGTETISQANKDTLSLGDRFTMLKNRVTGALGPFGEVIGVFGGMLAAIGPLLLGVSQIGPGLAAIGPKVAPLVASFLSFGAAVAPFLLIGAAIAGVGFVIFKFRKQIVDGFKAIGRFFASLPGKIIPFVKKFFPLIIGLLFPPAGIIAALIKFREPIFRFFRELPGRILRFFANAGRWLLDIGRRILAGLVAGLRAHFRFMVDFWLALPGRILGFFANAGRWLLDVGKAIFRGLLAGARALIGAYIGFWKALPGRVLKALGAVGRWLLDAGKKILRGLWEGAKALVGAYIGFWKALPGRVLRALGALGSFLFDKGKALLRGLWNGIRSIVGSVLTWFRELPGRLVNAIGDLATKFFDIGKQAIQGLINGFKSLGKAAVNTVKDIAVDVVTAPLKIFGIGSPSRVFASIGSDVVRGLAGGITGTGGLARRAIDDLTSGLTARAESLTLAPLSVGAANGGERSIATEPRQLVVQVTGRFETPGQIIDAADWQRRVSGWD